MSIDEISEAKEYDKDAKSIRVLGNIFLTKYFGPRCEYYDPTCECCKRWKLLDSLTNNPWECLPRRQY